MTGWDVTGWAVTGRAVTGRAVTGRSAEAAAAREPRDCAAAAGGVLHWGGTRARSTAGGVRGEGDEWEEWWECPGLRAAAADTMPASSELSNSVAVAVAVAVEAAVAAGAAVVAVTVTPRECACAWERERDWPREFGAETAATLLATAVRWSSPDASPN